MIRKGLALLVLLLASTEAMSQSLYRYKDENGVTVLNNSIPAQYIAQGYEVLDARTGRVVEKVAPVVVDDSGNRIYQTPEDKILLASYSSVEEILERRDRKIAKLDAEIANIQTDVRVLNMELESRQKEMARLQDAGRDLPEELLSHIATLESSLAGLEGALKRRKADQERTIKEYDTKSARFEMLQSADELL